MTDEQIARAKELRAQGLSYRKIGRILGLTAWKIKYYLNPAVQERERAYHRAYHKAHREEELVYYRMYDAAHREQKQKYQRERYKAKRKEILERRAADRDRHRAYLKAHYRAHVAYYEEKRARRRAQMKGDSTKLTDRQKAEIREIYHRAKEDRNVRCYICGKKIPLGHRHVDHIVPLSKGGKHVPSNLAITCDECNLKKGAKTPEEIGMLIRR